MRSAPSLALQVARSWRTGGCKHWPTTSCAPLRAARTLPLPAQTVNITTRATSARTAARPRTVKLKDGVSLHMATLDGLLAADNCPPLSQTSGSLKRKADEELRKEEESSRIAGRRLGPNTEPSADAEAVTSHDGTDGGDDQVADDENNGGDGGDGGGEETQTTMSKSQLKKQRRIERMAQFRVERAIKRKEKRHKKQARKRAEHEEERAAAIAAGEDPDKRVALPIVKPKPVPVTFIVDCDFEKYMNESELISLSSQLTRCYSVNRKARYQAQLFFSSFQGWLKTRFEIELKSVHRQWRNVNIIEEDFVEAGKQAGGVMGGLTEKLEDSDLPASLVPAGSATSLDETSSTSKPETAEDVNQGIVYLTSESPHTLEKLEANTSYVIGGLVDKNREKGLCFRLAEERNVRTARLPIGEYMKLQSRAVLTTNQVLEIMVKYLECGNWGEAFVQVIPKRKGGELKTDKTSSAPVSSSRSQAEKVESESGNGAVGVAASTETLVADASAEVVMHSETVA